MRRLTSIVAVGLGLIALAGCGDERPSEVSAEELVARGDEICREGQQRFAEIQREPLRNANDAADQTRKLIETANGELDKLRDLVPPQELAKPYERYLEARVRVVEIFKQGLDAAERDDDQGYVEAQSRAAADAANRQALARAVGFKVCSSLKRTG